MAPIASLRFHTRSCLAGVLAAFLLLSGTPASDAATLPQSHPYQVALRDYMATLTENDFQVELKPVAYRADYFKDTDTLARYWMLFLTPAVDIPSSGGIRVAARHFTLQAIEAGDTVNMNSGRSSFMDPKDAPWWTQWDYPGNPYKGSAPVMRRAFVAAAVDMMMQDQEHDDGKNKRSDFLGGSMIRFGYTYAVVKDAIPETARKAYEIGLIRMFEKLEALKPQGSGGSDMEFFQLVGMWYAAEALGDSYKARALTRAHRVISTITSRAGYEKHGGAFDTSYQGIALRFLTWAAMLYKDPTVSEALHKMLVLKSHLSLPEPDGTLFGPTHFNSATAADTPRDQWAWVSRDAAMAMIDEEAMYTVWSRIVIPDVTTMAGLVKKGILGLGAETPSGEAPGAWSENHWVNTINFAFDHYKPGFLGELLRLQAQNAMVTKPPFARNAPFIRDLNSGGEFLAARFADYGAIIHTGAIAKRWATGVSGKSGGSLSAFWTPKRGTAILGRCRATQSKENDEWTDENKRGPFTWGVHAITGIGPGGNFFSTARIGDIESKYDIRGTGGAVVTVTGTLSGNALADPASELKGRVTYQREFQMAPKGIQIRSGLQIEACDGIKELWEMIPVFFGDRRNHRKAPLGEIAFRVNGSWKPADETLVKADRVRLSRYGEHVTITLDGPRLVKLSPQREDRSYGEAIIQNVMININTTNGLPLVRYIITPGATE
jgi:hypothetical protein